MKKTHVTDWKNKLCFIPSFEFFKNACKIYELTPSRNFSLYSQTHISYDFKDNVQSYTNRL